MYKIAGLNIWSTSAHSTFATIKQRLSRERTWEMSSLKVYVILYESLKYIIETAHPLLMSSHI